MITVVCPHCGVIFELKAVSLPDNDNPESSKAGPQNEEPVGPDYSGLDDDVTWDPNHPENMTDQEYDDWLVSHGAFPPDLEGIDEIGDLELDITDADDFKESPPPLSE